MMIPLRKIKTCLWHAAGIVSLALVCTQGLHTIHLLHKGENIWPLLALHLKGAQSLTTAPPKRIAFLLGADIPALKSQKKGITDMLHAHGVPIEETAYFQLMICDMTAVIITVSPTTLNPIQLSQLAVATFPNLHIDELDTQSIKPLFDQISATISNCTFVPFLIIILLERSQLG